jgi:hypothetical protein
MGNGGGGGGNAGAKRTPARAETYVRIPTRIQARQTTAGEDVATLEGTVHAGAGDWVVTGVQGEHYPIPADVFARLYHATGTPGEYERNPEAVSARRATRHTEVPVPGGVLHAKPGDWIVTSPTRPPGVVAPDIFARTYARAPGAEAGARKAGLIE